MLTFEETKNWVFENLISKKGKLIPYKIRFNGECIKEVNPDVYNSIVYHSNHLPFECKFQQRVYDILNDIHETVMCDFCKKNPVTFIKYSQGYVKCCSHSCAQCHPDTREKIEKSCMKNYGVKHSMQSSIVQEKVKKTNLERRGVEWVLSDPKAHEKAEETNLEKYGVKNCSQREEIKLKKIQTSIEKYGVKSPNALKSVQIRSKNTKLERYGDPNYINVEKTKESHRKKHGVDWPMQNAEWFDKNYKGGNCFKWHEYEMPSGIVIKVQGYESQGLDFLLSKYDEDEIIYKKGKMPKIFYIGDDDKNHRYYPDFYIPKDNLIIEVKSWYIYTKEILKNLLKQDGVILNKYEYQILIF